MGKNTSFNLDEHYSAFIEQEVTSGRYRSASDVVRTALRQALVDGERGGESTPFDFDEFVARGLPEDFQDELQ